ncbi:MAG: hypothetical protein ACLPQY_01875, partial [Streptosporangiaceae bacterium]
MTLEAAEKLPMRSGRPAKPDQLLAQVGQVDMTVGVFGDDHDVGDRDGSVLSAVARVAQEGNHYSFWIGMLSVGVGGLLLCRVLLRERLAPGFLA